MKRVGCPEISYEPKKNLSFFFLIFSQIAQQFASRQRKKARPVSNTLQTAKLYHTVFKTT
jgi:hypothetical protein